MKRFLGSSVCFFLLLLSPRARSADVSVYSVTKGIYYDQAVGGDPVALTNNGYVFEADVLLTAAGAVRSALTQAPGSTNQALPLDDPLQFQLRDKYNTRAKLESHYPDGGYFMTMNTVSDGNRFIGLALTGSGYPNAPRVSDASAAQAINANGFFALTWDAMTGGTGSDFIQLRIEDTQGNKVFETPDFAEQGALNGTARFAWIEPGRLSPGKRYDATLRFQRNVTLNTANYPGATGIASYFARTTFPVGASAATAPDVIGYQVSKSRSFVQTDPSAVAPETGKEFTFEVKVNARDPNLVTHASVATPSANTLTLTPDSAAEDFDYTQSASTQGLFDSQFLNGTYSLSMATAHDGVRAVALDLSPTTYPPSPRIVNFDAAQAIRGGFVVQWEPWNDGRDLDWIQLRIEDTDNHTVFKTPDLGEQGALNGRAANTLIPAGQLTPGKSYRGRLFFHRIIAVDSTSYAGALGFSSFYCKTKFDLQAAPPDVKSISILKGHEFVQSSPAAPTPNLSTAFVFTASIVATDPGTILGATIARPSGAASAAVLQEDGKTFFFRDGCDDQNQVDAAYPEGTYTLQINTAHEGLRAVRLRLSGATYPNAPHLSDFSRTQAAQPDNALILNWDSFNGGNTNDFIYLEFANSAALVIYATKAFGKSTALNGNDTIQVIPNGTFQPSEVYSGALLFQKTATTDPSAYPGADVWSAYFARTRFHLTTAGPGNPAVLSSWTVGSNGNLSFTLNALKGASYRIDGSSNLTEWISLGNLTTTGTQTFFADPSTTRRPSFFYRAVLTP